MNSETFFYFTGTSYREAGASKITSQINFWLLSYLPTYTYSPWSIWITSAKYWRWSLDCAFWGRHKLFVGMQALLVIEKDEYGLFKQ